MGQQELAFGGGEFHSLWSCRFGAATLARRGCAFRNALAIMRGFPSALAGVRRTMHTLQQLRSGELAGATRLDLSCGLREFPREIFELADSLEVLNLSGNALDSLPDDLGRLHRLKVLFCSANDFAELPAAVGDCPALSMVGFKSNRIERVPAAALPPALRWLILTDNRIATLPEELAEVVAVDLEESRLVRVRENLQRLGLQASLVAADARATGEWWDGKPFQRILLDAPCSATGVIRRHPDIKLARKPEDIAALAHLQGELLDALWPTLEVGGVLLYATCSVMPAENSDSIAAFLARTPGARELDLPGPWGMKQPHGRQLLPQVEGHDGFYYAKLIKISAR
ncbi:hypothetical protein K3Z94_00245 [Pseudomonas aeruginosa]|nr:hypothetical protein [Pseudomonas aeruginosa]